MKRDNMYEWITKKWTPVGGECPISCPYCYVKAMGLRFPAIAAKYSGEPRLVGPWPRFKAGDVVFVGHMTDLFAMPFDIIPQVLAHCCRWYEATYVFQTKVPERIESYLLDMPPNRMFGTTIESDEVAWYPRARAMGQLRIRGEQIFVTVEPIQRFSPDFADILVQIGPAFVNIGADSKRNGLAEPTGDEVRELIAVLRAAGVEVREKANLKRITGEGRKET